MNRAGPASGRGHLLDKVIHIGLLLLVERGTAQEPMLFPEIRYCCHDDPAAAVNGRSYHQGELPLALIGSEPVPEAADSDEIPRLATTGLELSTNAPER